MSLAMNWTITIAAGDGNGTFVCPVDDALTPEEALYKAAREYGVRPAHGPILMPGTVPPQPLSKECPKCGRGVVPEWHVSNRDLGISARDQRCGAITYRKPYCHEVSPFDEHLNWACECGFSWRTPTRDAKATVDAL